MTDETLREGQRLVSLISDYNRTLAFFENMNEEEIKGRIAEFLTGARMVPNKDQMASVMRNAVIESCKLCIGEAQKKFEGL